MEKKYQVMPDLSPDEYEALKADIAENGVQVPVVKDEYGDIIDGYHRVKVCKDLGIEDYPGDIVKGLSEDEKIELAYKLNSNRRHLSSEWKKREAVKLRNEKEWSYRRIGRALGVVHTTVIRWLEKEERGANAPPETITGADGKEYPAERSPENGETGSASEPAGEVEPAGDLPHDVGEEENAGAEMETAAVPESGGEEGSGEGREIITPESGRTSNNDVVFSSDSNEWYTPDEIIDRVLDVFGEIDLDPCSNSHENPNVPALNHYTKADDGLSQLWHGRVYMNPPYGREVRDWIKKLICEYQSDRVKEAIVLIASRTDTQWFHELVHNSHMWCAISGRLKFSGSDNGATFPSAVFFITDTQGREQDFYWSFENLGIMFRRVEDMEMMQG